MELPEDRGDGIQCPNCEDGTEMTKNKNHYRCPKCGYEETR